jgi:hypothetical protein
VSIAAIAAAWDLQLPPLEKLVALALADHANDAAVCWPSVTRISTRSGVSRSTVIRTIGELERRGLIGRSRRTGARNGYRLNWCHRDTSVPQTPVSAGHLTGVTQTPHQCQADTSLVSGRHQEASGSFIEASGTVRASTVVDSEGKLQESIAQLYDRLCPDQAPFAGGWTADRGRRLQQLVHRWTAKYPAISAATWWGGLFEGLVAKDFFHQREFASSALDWLLDTTNFASAVQVAFGSAPLAKSAKAHG